MRRSFVITSSERRPSASLARDSYACMFICILLTCTCRLAVYMPGYTLSKRSALYSALRLCAQPCGASDRVPMVVLGGCTHVHAGQLFACMHEYTQTPTVVPGGAAAAVRVRSGMSAQG